MTSFDSVSPANGQTVFTTPGFDEDEIELALE